MSNIVEKSLTKLTAEIVASIVVWVIASLSSGVILIQIGSFFYAVIGGIILGCIATWIFMILYKKINPNTPEIPKIDNRFQFIEKDLTYVYITKTHLTFTVKNKLKAKKNNVKSFKEYQGWTGRGRVDIISKVPGQEIKKYDLKGSWQGYEIFFPHELSKGEIVECEVFMDLWDDRGVAQPFLRYTVKKPTKCLKLNVSLSPQLGVKDVTCETFSPVSGEPCDSFNKHLDIDGNASWKIKNPELLYIYEITWKFPEEKLSIAE